MGRAGRGAPGGEEMNALLLDGALALIRAFVLDTVFELLAQLIFVDAEAAKLEREKLGLEEGGDLHRKEAIGRRGSS